MNPPSPKAFHAFNHILEYVDCMEDCEFIEISTLHAF